MSSEDTLQPRVPDGLLRRSLENRRIHSAYLLSGPGEPPRAAALAFVRALVCERGGADACEACTTCQRSQDKAPVALDGSGKRGPLLRHVGDHPDLFWVERGADDTRVRIAQVRELQQWLRLRSQEGAQRAAVIADAEWLNQEAQNALLRLLEEPPPDTTLLLVTTTATGLLATVRSRCQRVAFPAGSAEILASEKESVRAASERLEAIARATVPELLDWAEEFRGARAPAASGVEELLEVGCAWLHRRAREAASVQADCQRALDAYSVLRDCRKTLVQRNANPQMVAERALLALREAG